MQKTRDDYRFCLRCGQKAHTQDKQGNPWCNTHLGRHTLMNWGNAHNWPAMTCLVVDAADTNPGYAVAQGYAYWFTMCGIGDDRWIRAMLVSIDEYVQGRCVR